MARIWEVATGQYVSPVLQHEGVVLSVAFSPDGRTLLISNRDGTSRLWDLVPDNRPVTDLVLFAQLMSGFRLDQFGTLERIPATEQLRILEELRTKYPSEFRITPEQTRAWHLREAKKWWRMGSPDAALFHHLRGGGWWPMLTGVAW